MLTNRGNQELYIKLYFQSGNVEFAKYVDFMVGPAGSNYRVSINVSSYTGSAGQKLLVLSFLYEFYTPVFRRDVLL